MRASFKELKGDQSGHHAAAPLRVSLHLRHCLQHRYPLLPAATDFG